MQGIGSVLGALCSAALLTVIFLAAGRS